MSPPSGVAALHDRRVALPDVEERGASGGGNLTVALL